MDFIARGQSGYIVVSVTALLATASGINAWVSTAMQISAAMARADQLPGMFPQLAWRKGTRGSLVGVAAILLAINFFDLTALANIASAAFIFSHMAVQAAHWPLIDETRGSRPLVGLALLSMAVCWLSFFGRPYSLNPGQWRYSSSLLRAAGSLRCFLSAGPAGLGIHHLPRGRSFSEPWEPLANVRKGHSQRFQFFGVLGIA